MNENQHPEQITGTPQSAAAEAAGEPVGPVVISGSLRKLGNRYRKRGLVHPMPKELGGGHVILKSMTCSAISNARPNKELKIRENDWVVQSFGKDGDLRGRAMIELNRYTVWLAVESWHPEEAQTADDETVYQPKEIAAMSPVDTRQLIKEIYLTPLDLTKKDPQVGADGEREDDMDQKFFTHLHLGLNRCDTANATILGEAARLGKPYVLGPKEDLEEEG